MARRLGEIFVELKLDNRKYRSDLQKEKQETERSVREMENAQVSSSKRVAQVRSENAKVNQQMISQERRANADLYRSLTRGISQANDEYRRALGPQQTFLQKTLATSRNVLAAAPGFALATAAIGATYTALRTLTQEFANGLRAVEDYNVKVASTAAFLTTFNKNVTQINAAEVYRNSTREAQRLVETMEILDARTIATGRDLTTMAEQFIKGGVAIDTSNKSTLDGFVNIANALKLLTQGQNQEIQLRQEIRALVQGQLRDTNILAKTLQSIDPNIKENIKLWRQQGTLIENVGRLLIGFGPAARDLESTWAVVGTTLETIHNRILRSAFRGTYENLIGLVKDWNSQLMDSNGNLTVFAENIAVLLGSLASLFAYLINLFAQIVKSVVVVGSVVGGMIAEIRNIGNSISNLQSDSAGYFDKIAESARKSSEESQSAWDKAINSVKANFTQAVSDTLNLKPLREDISTSIDLVFNIDTKIRDLLIKLGLLEGETSTQIRSRGIDSLLAPSHGPVPQIQTGISHIPQLSKGEIEELSSEVRKYIDDLKRQSDTYKLNALDLAKYEIEQGKYKDIIDDLNKSGNVSIAQELKKQILMQAGILHSKQQREEEENRARQLRDSAITAIDTYGNRLEEHIQRLKGGKSELEKFRIEQGKINDALKVAGDGASYTKTQLEELANQYEMLLKEDRAQKLQERLQKLKIEIFPESEDDRRTQKLRADLDGLVAAYQEAGIEVPESIQAMYNELETQSDNWLSGAKSGLMGYARDAKNSFDSLGNSFANVFKSMEDVFVDFVKTGKLEFSSLADSIVNDLIRIAIQKTVTGPLAEGLANSSFLSGAGSFITTLFSANGNAFSGGNISNLSNSILTGPTGFSYGAVDKFAHGAGVAGEAGWEAIMPLKRGPDGKLGVASSGGGGVNIIVQNNTSEQAKVTETQSANGGRDFLVQIGEYIATDVSGGGQVHQAFRRTFGINPTLARR